MNEEVQQKIDELEQLLIKYMASDVVGVELFFSNSEKSIIINTRTANNLRSNGISMKNLKGDFIK